MSQFQSWQNRDAMQLLQQQLLHQPNPLGEIYIPNVTNESFLPQNYQLPLATTIQSCPQHLSQSPNYPSQINPCQVGQFLPEQVFSQECTTNYQHSSGLTSLDPTEEKILFGSDDDVSSSTRVTSQGNVVTQDGCCGTFASINSGSWSALMQDAVDASSSETGLHEEWSGLSFQKPEEPSILNNSSTLTANQPSNFVVNEGHTWNLPYMAVSGSQNLFNLSAQYSSVISENPHFAANQQMKETEEELRHQGVFQSNCSDRASIGPLANFYSQHITPMTSQSMMEPNCKVERARSNATTSLDIPISVTADSSTSHESSLKQVSLQNQFISNQPLSHNQYPSVHRNPNLPQIDHYISQSDFLDSKSSLCSQDTIFGSFDFTKIASNTTISNPCKSIIENSLDSVVNNLWNGSLVQQNLASIHPAKVAPSILFQSKIEGDKSLPGIAKVSTHPLNQDQKQDIHGNARMLGISSDEVRNLKERSHFSGNIGSALRMVQGNPCTKDPTLQFGPKSPKRGCNDGPHEVGPRPKKQRTETSALVSWFRVVDGSHQRLCIARIKEHGWPQATNRLNEKVEDITKLKEDASSEALTRKRLVLTTQLAWQLLPALQYEYLTEDATLAYQKITYCVSRSALEEACTLISSRDNSSLHSSAADRMLQKFSGKSAGGSTLLEAVEKIMQKSTTLESHFLRLDKRSCLVDLKLMWQELERYAIVSCLGKFHTQSQHVNPEGTSNPQTAPRRHLAQRHATLVVLQIDTASLHGVPCLSL